jgi:hypothetical protein
MAFYFINSSREISSCLFLIHLGKLGQDDHDAEILAKGLALVLDW